MITTTSLGYDNKNRNFCGEISDFEGYNLDEVDNQGYRGVWVKSAKTGVTKFYRYVGVETDPEGDVYSFEFENAETNTTLTLFND